MQKIVLAIELTSHGVPGFVRRVEALLVQLGAQRVHNEIAARVVVGVPTSLTKDAFFLKAIPSKRNAA